MHSVFFVNMPYSVLKNFAIFLWAYCFDIWKKRFCWSIQKFS